MVNFSKKIIKILSERPAISLESLALDTNPILTSPLSRKEIDTKTKYAITRSIKGLEEAGLIENLASEYNSQYIRLTKEGRKKAHSIQLEHDTAVISTQWDGFWRIILLDLPEDRKNEREALRYLLKKAGFVCIKNSVWVSIYPYEYLFTNIKKDLGLKTELIILVTDKLDEDTEKEFLSFFNK